MPVPATAGGELMRLYTEWGRCSRDRTRRLVRLALAVAVALGVILVFGEEPPPIWKGWP